MKELLLFVEKHTFIMKWKTYELSDLDISIANSKFKKVFLFFQAFTEQRNDHLHRKVIKSPPLCYIWAALCCVRDLSMKVHNPEAPRGPDRRLHHLNGEGQGNASPGWTLPRRLLAVVQTWLPLLPDLWVAPTVFSDGSLLILSAHLFLLPPHPLINQAWLLKEKMWLWFLTMIKQTKKRVQGGSRYHPSKAVVLCGVGSSLPAVSW